MPGRIYSRGDYRFGFQGQQKDDEISGDRNSYTAQFWEYDPRLGRRWNIDPKPNPSISVYACFNNNPIWLTDPLGDTIQIKYGGFLGMFKKTATYIDGKYLDKHGKEINSKNKFLNLAKKTISDLNEKKEGGKLVKELSDSKHFFIIKPMRGSLLKGDGDFVADNEKNSSTPGLGSGGILRLSKRQSSTEPGFVALGHEMGHALASSQGKSNYDTWYEYIEIDGSATPVIKDEQVGLYYENLIRIEHNLPIREHYHSDSEQGPATETHGLD
jgi:RHS repeat-associated protein